MKCEKCGCEADYVVITELKWFVMQGESTILIEGFSPARRMRTLCLDCFSRCAEVFKKEDE